MKCEETDGWKLCTDRCRWCCRRWILTGIDTSSCRRRCDRRLPGPTNHTRRVRRYRHTRRCLHTQLATCVSRKLWKIQRQTHRQKRLSVVIILRTHLFRLFYPRPDSWLLDWHRYTGPCSDVSLLGPL